MFCLVNYTNCYQWAGLFPNSQKVTMKQGKFHFLRNWPIVIKSYILIQVINLYFKLNLWIHPPPRKQKSKTSRFQMGISSQGTNVREITNVSFACWYNHFAQTCDYMPFLFPDAFLYHRQSFWFSLYSFFSLPTEGPDHTSSPFSMCGNISHLFDEITSLYSHPFDLVSKRPWQPLFISKLSSFLFHKIYYFSNKPN